MQFQGIFLLFSFPVRLSVYNSDANQWQVLHLTTESQWPWNLKKASKLVRKNTYSFHNAFIHSPLSLSSFNRFLTCYDRPVAFTASPPITMPGKAQCVCMLVWRLTDQRSSFSTELCCLKAWPVTINLRGRTMTWERVCSTDQVSVGRKNTPKGVQLFENNSHCCQATFSVNLKWSPWAGVSVKQLIICLHRRSYRLNKQRPTCTKKCFCSWAGHKAVNFTWLRKLLLHTHPIHKEKHSLVNSESQTCSCSTI